MHPFILVALLAAPSEAPPPEAAYLPPQVELDEKEEIIQATLADPEGLQYIWSIAICRWTVIRAEAKREIDTEKRYAREGAGVVNMASLYSQQRAMRTADERIARARSALKDAKVRALPCSDAPVFNAVVCVTIDHDGPPEDGAPDACRKPQAALMLEMLYRTDALLRP